MIAVHEHLQTVTGDIGKHWRKGDIGSQSKVFRKLSKVNTDHSFVNGFLNYRMYIVPRGTRFESENLVANYIVRR